MKLKIIFGINFKQFRSYRSLNYEFRKISVVSTYYSQVPTHIIVETYRDMRKLCLNHGLLEFILLFYADEFTL